MEFTIKGRHDEDDLMLEIARLIADPDEWIDTISVLPNYSEVKGKIRVIPDRSGGYAKALEGISYREWVRLSMAMNAYFDEEKRKRENEIQLARAEDVEKIIRRQFGG